MASKATIAKRAKGFDQDPGTFLIGLCDADTEFAIRARSCGEVIEWNAILRNKKLRKRLPKRDNMGFKKGLSN